MLQAHYSFGLVLVSVCISICSCFAALSLADGINAASTVALRRFWVVSGSITLGLGVWAMHFLGLLALELPVPIFFFWPTVVLSMVFAVAASGIALNIVTREVLTYRRLLIGGMLMATGMAAMHHTGMAAMRSAAREEYDPAFMTASVFAAVVFSCVGLAIAYASRLPDADTLSARATASAVMGLGIAAMHYIAMVGVQFVPSAQEFSMAGAIRVDGLGQSMIALGTVLILIMAFSMATMDMWRFRELRTVLATLRAQQVLLKDREQLRELNTMLSELSVRDALTGLYNRRHFDAALETEWRRATRGLAPVSLIMMDLDCFKSLNDVYGHQCGDACLREVARELQEHQRRGQDVLARYGGEEFALLLPGADADAARIIAEGLRASVHALGIENSGSTVSDVVTVSIGVHSAQPQIGDDLDRFIREADEALYEAKRLGKNRVEATTDDDVCDATVSKRA